jgi:hypothetical protein
VLGSVRDSLPLNRPLVYGAVPQAKPWSPDAILDVMPQADALINILLASSGPGGSDEAISAVALLAIIVSTLAIFLIALIVITVVRHRRYRTGGKKNASDALIANAWEEAGRRVQPDSRRDASS